MFAFDFTVQPSPINSTHKNIWKCFCHAHATNESILKFKNKDQLSEIKGMV
jgi:hypothetical protein